MNNEEKLKIIEEIKKDITYFNNMDFINIAAKFTRDLNVIETLIKERDELQHVDKTVK